MRWHSCGSFTPTPALTRSLLGEDQLIAVHAHAHSRLLDEDIEEITCRGLTSRTPRGLLRVALGPARRSDPNHRVDRLRRPGVGTAAAGKRHRHLDARAVDDRASPR